MNLFNEAQRPGLFSAHLQNWSEAFHKNSLSIISWDRHYIRFIKSPPRSLRTHYAPYHKEKTNRKKPVFKYSEETAASTADHGDNKFVASDQPIPVRSSTNPLTLLVLCAITVICYLRSFTHDRPVEAMIRLQDSFTDSASYLGLETEGFTGDAKTSASHNF